MKAVNVAITEYLLLDLLELCAVYTIRNARMDKNNADVVILTISGEDLPEVPEGGEPRRATIECQKRGAWIRLL